MKWIRYFILPAGFILLVAALSRFLIVFGNAQVMMLAEPMLGIPLRYAVLLVGGFELAVAYICLFGKRASLQIGLLAWLATNYAVYRIALFTMGYHHQATAIGSLTDPLHMSRGLAGITVGLIPAFLLLGSYAALVWLWLGNRAELAHSREAEFSKMSCPSCGTHIKFALQNLGQQLPCPRCNAAITLLKPENLKMSCFFCKGHIEFPPHAIGEKISCPHCKMNITLLKPT